PRLTARRKKDSLHENIMPWMIVPPGRGPGRGRGRARRLGQGPVPERAGPAPRAGYTWFETGAGVPSFWRAGRAQPGMAAGRPGLPGASAGPAGGPDAGRRTPVL